MSARPKDPRPRSDRSKSDHSKSDRPESERAEPARAATSAARGHEAARPPVRPKSDSGKSDGDRMRVLRWPALLVLPLLVAAAVFVERREPTGPLRTTGADPVMPVAPGPDALSSTWYCAGGTTAARASDSGDGSTSSTSSTSSTTTSTTTRSTTASTDGERGQADPVVVISNAGDARVAAHLSVYASDGEVVKRDIDVDAASRSDVVIHDIVSAPYVAVLVEADAGELSVSQEVTGAHGRDVSACASGPSTSWYFPAGTTRAGAEMVLSVFNPFPADAVLDISFDTDDGVRTPQAFQGLVVPGGSVVPVDVSAVVTLRDRVATAVTVRSGRVVVSQIQTSNGQDGSIESLGVTLGAPDVALAWVFPDGVGGVGYSERFVLYNPAEQTAEVELVVQLDDPEINGSAEPFAVRVPAGRHAVVDVFADGRVPPEVAHTTVARSTNDVAFVIEREITGSGEAAQPGRSFTMGAALASTYWLSPVGSAVGASGVAVIVSNPFTDSSAMVTIESIGDGGRHPVEDMGGIEIAPGARRIFVLTPRSSDGDGSSGDGDSGSDRPERDDDAPAISLAVVADRPVVVETRFGFGDGNDISYLVADPVRGAVSKIEPSSLWMPDLDTTVVAGG